MITLKISIDNEAYAVIFAEMLSNFNFVSSVEIPELSKTFTTKNEENVLVVPAIKKQNITKYYGLWSDKKITDVKQFRRELWRKK